MENGAAFPVVCMMYACHVTAGDCGVPGLAGMCGHALESDNQYGSKWDEVRKALGVTASFCLESNF